MSDRVVAAFRQTDFMTLGAWNPDAGVSIRVSVSRPVVYENVPVRHLEQVDAHIPTLLI
jgi:hypothetical protein